MSHCRACAHSMRGGGEDKVALGSRRRTAQGPPAWHCPMTGAGEEETGRVQPSRGNRGSPSRAGVQGLRSSLESLGRAVPSQLVQQLSTACLDCVTMGMADTKRQPDRLWNR